MAKIRANTRRGLRKVRERKKKDQLRAKVARGWALPNQRRQPGGGMGP